MHFTSLSTAVPLSLWRFANLFTQYGKVLSELDHEYDEGSSRTHAGGPEERVENCTAAMRTVQKDTGLMLAGVMVTCYLLVRLQMF